MQRLIESLDALKIKAKETLVELMKETKRNKKNVFIRIFPTQLLLSKYERYLEASPNHAIYKQLFSFLYNNPILKELPTGLSSELRDPAKSPFADRRESTSQEKSEEIVLTGDDLVVEYVSRLTTACKLCPDLSPHISDRLNQFIHYKVWSSKAFPPHVNSLVAYLTFRIDDMKMRKLKLYLSKCPGS